MLIRLANHNLPKQSQKPKKPRPELTLVTVTTRNDVDIEPGYHRGADHYLVTNVFGTHRLYSLTVNRKGLTGPLIVDDVMKRLRQSAAWTRVVAHGPEFYPVGSTPSTAQQSGVIMLMLGDVIVGELFVKEEGDYTLVLDKQFDSVSRDTLSTVINEFLSKEIAMAAYEISDVGKGGVTAPSVDDVKAFILDYERRLGEKLNWEDWEDLLDQAYGELADEEGA